MVNNETLRTQLLSLERLYDLEQGDLQLIANHFTYWMENKTTYSNTSRAWSQYCIHMVYDGDITYSVDARRGIWRNHVNKINDLLLKDYEEEPHKAYGAFGNYASY